MGKSVPVWSLRRATFDDRDLLYEINHQTMRGYVEAVWGWDDEFQERFFDEHFEPEGERQIIQVEAQDIGMIEVWERPRDLLLASIRVVPEWQGQGIGTSVIRSVIARAANVQKPVSLTVLKINVRAQQLYRREGFDVTSETVLHFRMTRL